MSTGKEVTPEISAIKVGLRAQDSYSNRLTYIQQHLTGNARKTGKETTKTGAASTNNPP
jgi:hypothetical protein